ncbi:MAG TPA: choice-of-anchor Q domain-containing protein, partial [Isosphaeraceae bacterium]|nr:choice-of-anchor Q domain-containing protein [Isosphaeraceae bacterium]
MSSRPRPSRPRPSLRPIRRRATRPIVDRLEERVVPSAVLNLLISHAPGHFTTVAGSTPQATPLTGGSGSPVGYTPAQVRTAYGLANLTFGATAADGTGQTIAIVDAYDDPAFLNSIDPNFKSSDLAVFDQQFGLPDPPSFTKVNQTGGTTLPGTDPNGAGFPSGTWEMEEALDIEWAHAMAPRANIVVVEANTGTNNADLLQAVQTAAGLPGVTTISMSWGLFEASGEQSMDPTFTTPSGHPGVTFLAATGDSGSPGDYPAASPNVLAVGGTTLNLNPDNTIASETGWSGSGGGTSPYESEPAFQKGVQSTGFRTIPDVSFVADPNTGVAIYDSFDNTDGSGAWFQIGGTSLASPSWAGILAVVDQGRAIVGAGPLDGASETLPFLYALSSGDFHDITAGSNGGYNAGPGYDEVTGLGSPKADSLIPELASFGKASQLVVTAQPPGRVIVNDGFGLVVAAEDAAGHPDPAFQGTVTLALAANPGGATLGGTLSATASDGVAVFDGLTLNRLGSGYTLTVTSNGLSSVTTAKTDVVANATPWQGTFYPTASDASLRDAIAQADSDGFASNTIVLSAGHYDLTNLQAGQLVIQNASKIANRSLTIVGQGPSATVLGAGPGFSGRIVEVVGAGMNVTFENLSIEGGMAHDGGAVGGNAAIGGGLLVDGATVTLANVAVSNDKAQGSVGGAGAAGAAAAAGGPGSTGGDGRGGGVYLAGGTLILDGVTFAGDQAIGGAGGAGGAGGSGLNPANPTQGQAGADGGAGGAGGTGAGGALYVGGGTVALSQTTFQGDQAIGGAGGAGGTGGHGGVDKPGGAGGLGGNAGMASGGALYLSQGRLTLAAATLQGNSAVGGAGGAGGLGGDGGSAFAGTTGSIFGSSGFARPAASGTVHAAGTGGDGGDGGAGGKGAAANGGGLYVTGGTLTLLDSTVDGNLATGGAGGQGGRGGRGALGTLGGFGTLTGTNSHTGGTGGLLGGKGGQGGAGDSGYGGGLYVAGGTVTLAVGTLSNNVAGGGQGGSGGTGGRGALAGGITGSIATGAQPGLSGSLTGIFGGGAHTGGPGGNGGTGGNGQAGGLYVSGGALTLLDETVAANTAKAGAGGTYGSGGTGGSLGAGHGVAGSPGTAGTASTGGLYVGGGSVHLVNSTVALNGAGGIDQAAGTVALDSTLVAGNGGLDVVGTVTANHSLIQAVPTTTPVGANNLVGVDPRLDPNGLQANGGPTRIVALTAGSPAFGAGSNVDGLPTDQRGFAPRTGANGTDIGSFQHDATPDTAGPTVTLQAPGVTSSNAATSNPYTFTLTFTDHVAVAAATLVGATVQVIPPGGGPPINATVVKTTALGASDPLGDAATITVTYQITPPGGSWSTADDGTYTITLGGTPVTDLAGNAVAQGNVGTFTVNVVASAGPPVFTQTPDQAMSAGATDTVTLSATDPAGLSLTYTAVAETQAYWLESTLGLYEDPHGYWQNNRGQQEKYLRGKVSYDGYTGVTGDYWYYLLPSGDLYEFTPPYSNRTLTGALVAHLGVSYYNDPTQLTGATNTAVP